MKYISFGLAENNQIRAVDISEDHHHFDVVCNGAHYCHLDLQVPGKHNVLNALAAAAAAWRLGIPGEAVAKGLATFTGADRRMQFKGKFNGADVYDDYAHHPGELNATIDAVRSMGYKRMILAFQPHTYTRTHALFNEFVRELKKPDVVILAEIYAARERNTVGISSRDIQNRIDGALYCQTLPEVTEVLRELAQPGDIILTVGAGDIYRAGEALLK
jgi:UDP-N-acetylmuramate--alanine ligase